MHLEAVAPGKGILLDDFVDSSFTYHPVKPHAEPWVGIFHHPVTVDSPLRTDRVFEIRHLLRNKRFAQARKFLRGAIALCPQVADYLSSALDVPVIFLRHPTETDVPPWQDYRLGLLQLGSFLRNTRFIYELNTSIPRYRITPHLSWDVKRDNQLKVTRPMRGDVIELPRLDNEAYDERLSHSVVCTWLYGSAANNVVIECIARCTPLLVNRTPAVVAYLGQDYPLYYAPGWESRIDEAAQYLRSKYIRNIMWLDVNQFQKAVKGFCYSVTES